jgi:protein-L-isoaspartate(D-aspartate) O-methyltransferase
VKKEFSNHCYENIPLPVDCNQTISQPFVVAFMIHCLELKKNDRVLEIGTGTGYQTVILANLCKYVCTIEKFQKLLDQAKINHKKLKLKNINYMLGDGADGWIKPVLFDAIIVSASVEKISCKLLENLKDNGRLIFPKKYSFGKQKLLLLKKVSNFKYTSQKLFDVEFVPLL